MTEIGNAYGSVAVKPQRRESLHDLQELHCAQFVKNRGRAAVVQSTLWDKLPGHRSFNPRKVQTNSRAQQSSCQMRTASPLHETDRSSTLTAMQSLVLCLGKFHIKL